MLSPWIWFRRTAVVIGAPFPLLPEVAASHAELLAMAHWPQGRRDLFFFFLPFFLSVFLSFSLFFLSFYSLFFHNFLFCLWRRKRLIETHGHHRLSGGLLFIDEVEEATRVGQEGCIWFIRIWNVVRADIGSVIFISMNINNSSWYWMLIHLHKIINLKWSFERYHVEVSSFNSRPKLLLHLRFWLFISEIDSFCNNAW